MKKSEKIERTTELVSNIASRIFAVYMIDEADKAFYRKDVIKQYLDISVSHAFEIWSDVAYQMKGYEEAGVFDESDEEENYGIEEKTRKPHRRALTRGREKDQSRDS